MEPLAAEAIPLKTELDLVSARQVGRNMAVALGFGKADQTRLATAISELARNVVRYAGEGLVEVWDKSDAANLKLQVVVSDRGPGILDIEQALEDGYSTSGGLGAGLPGTKRLVHEFQITSEPGNTIVSIAMVKRRTVG
jgi:serine/threonine-protein kinase RsbT